MDSIEKTLKYYELLMVYKDTSKFINYPLPENYHYEFYKKGDELDWVNIHISSGEFTSIEKGLETFHQFYDSFLKELSNRCIFIVNDQNEKIGTATISLLEETEDEYEAAVDWVAIKKEDQGKHLSKPLISRFIQLSHELGHKKLILHTQTHTWLAAKLYLDLGFVPYKPEENKEGWEILKTLTSHPMLKNFSNLLPEKMYSETALLIYNKLKEIHERKFNYEIWHKNGRNDVYVNDSINYYEYKYKIVKDKIVLEEIFRKSVGKGEK